MSDSGQRFVHKNYFRIHVCAIAALGILDWRLPGVVLAWPCVLGFNLSGAVNVFCHRDGLRDHRLVNLFGLGDGLHKSHHSSPSSYANSAGGGFDLAALVIRHVLKTEKELIEV
jgi:fatty-acid desaturase